ncbi:NUDIX hydrolase [Paenibacillus sp. y28]|uniref:NUDIX hydrolase n=1 Tax=Paenibacillus sp. y28 TaxID=3129110 RepID=UPI003019D1F3
MFTYTICFIQQGNQILMLNRNKAPAMGLWHGVGGKIESGETPNESILREIFEETGIRVNKVQFKGVVSWDDNGVIDGMYAFIVKLPENYIYETPRKVDEGILEWKEISWVLNVKNNGIPSNIPHFLPFMINESTSYQFKCIYKNGKLLECNRTPINDTILSFAANKEEQMNL